MKSNFFFNFFFLIFNVYSIFREILQKNEGGWEFSWDEESTKGSIILEVPVGKFLDSSLIDVDLHPSYVSIVIKSKVSFIYFLIFK